MLKGSVTPKEVCNLLNEMLEQDYDCIHSLITNYVKCNDTVANHPTVQVRKYPEDKHPLLGMLGLLNGMFGIDDNGYGAIKYEIDDSGKILAFKET